MGYFSFYTKSSCKIEAYTVPASGLMKVSIGGTPSIMFNPENKTWEYLPKLSELEKSEIESELLHIDEARRGVYLLEQKVPMNSSFDDLISLYDEFERALPKKTVQDTFKQRLDVCDKINRSDKEFLLKLNTLRNIKSHSNDLHLSFGLTLEPKNEKAILQIKQIIDKLNNTEPVDSKMIPIGKVLSATFSDFIVPKASQMLANQYSHIPIINSENKLEGIFSPDVVFRALVEDGITGLESNTTFRDFERYCAITSKDIVDNTVFIKRKTSVAKIRAQFNTFTKTKKRLSIAFITANGKENEPILGLITVWDLQ